MANNNGTKPTAEQTAIEAAITGTTQSIPAASNEVVGGVTYAQPQILAKLQGWLATYTAVASLRLQLTTAIAARTAAAAEAKEFLKDFKATLVGQFGRLSTQLTVFGFGPAKTPTPLTAAQKLQKAAKAKATRELNHTVGPKQKAANVKAANSPTLTVAPGGEVTVATPPAKPSGS